jgi:hypothetical protein
VQFLTAPLNFQRDPNFARENPTILAHLELQERKDKLEKVRLLDTTVHMQDCRAGFR